MPLNKEDRMDKDITNVIHSLKSGLIPIIVITGTLDEMRQYREVLMDMLAQEVFQLNQLDLTTDDQPIVPANNEQKVELLIVWGLERLSPQNNRTYALRSFLDTSKYQGLKTIMFCESDAYRAHFGNYAAPFYQFCLRHPIGGN